MRLLGLVLLFICGLKSIEGCKCAPGEVDFEDSCYFFSKDKRNYMNAKSECERRGGTLAIINCEAENNFLKAKANGQFWLGASDAIKEGEWILSNGRLAVFTDWGKGEPNNAGTGEDCLAFQAKSMPQWNDWFCNRATKYICEFPQ